jgi:putative addiction module killer protein
MKVYNLEEYVTTEGKSPFGEWLRKLKDKRTVARIFTRLDRVQLGNFGDYKPIKGVTGLYELREHHGAGCRIFFSVIDDKIVLLLAGSSKRDQQRVIEKAAQYLADYERRV